MYCWGLNSSGVLGNTSVAVGDFTNVPVASPTTGEKVAQITRPGAMICMITAASGDTYCWGSNGSGRLGINDPSVTQSLDPMPVVGPVIKPVVTVGAAPTTGTGTNVIVNNDGTVTFTSPAMPGGRYALTFDYFDGATKVATVTKADALMYGDVAEVVIDDPKKDVKPPKNAFVCGVGMTCTVTWTPALGPNGEFQGGTQYTANVEVKADAGYTLDNLGAISINGHLVPLTYNDGQTARGSYTFTTPTARDTVAATAVPTLSEWALALLALAVLSVAAAGYRRRA
jgi:hypothetical protein